MSKKLLSIIIPVYNEEGNVDSVYRALLGTFQQVADRYDLEILFTDNHSTDGTFDRLKALATEDKRVKVLRFSKNFGFQRSILTGYLRAQGDAAIQIDCDLQDPPELLLEFIQRWENGYKVVYGVRRTRQEGWLLERTRKLFYRLVDRLSEDDLPHDAGDFRLVDRVVLDQLAAVNDQQPYLRGLIASIGFEQVGIPYDRRARAWGSTKFSLAELLTLALDGVLNHSVVPLRLATFAGLTLSLLSVLGGLAYAAGRLFFGQDWPPGFATLSVLSLLGMGLNALFLGVIGEYLGRIYKQVKPKPLTIVECELNT